MSSSWRSHWLLCQCQLGLLYCLYTREKCISETNGASTASRYHRQLLPLLLSTADGDQYYLTVPAWLQAHHLPSLNRKIQISLTKSRIHNLIFEIVIHAEVAGIAVTAKCTSRTPSLRRIPRRRQFVTSTQTAGPSVASPDHGIRQDLLVVYSVRRTSFT